MAQARGSIAGRRVPLAQPQGDLGGLADEKRAEIGRRTSVSPPPFTPHQVPVCFVAVTGGRNERRTTALGADRDLRPTSTPPVLTSPASGSVERRGQGAHVPPAVPHVTGTAPTGFSYYNEAEADEVTLVVSWMLASSQLPPSFPQHPSPDLH